MATVTSEVSVDTLVESATSRGRSRHIVTALALLCIAVVYVVSIVRIHPTYLFGLTEDDGIYLSSAKALAEGRGYILPYLPGNPPATKYPILYPWMLSLVWRWNPSFPANLPLAISVSVAFGVAFLMAAFAFFSGLGGLGRKEALILTGFLAVHPLVMFFGASVLSEMPFAFFALASMSIADGALRPGGKLSRGAASGILAGLAALTRVLGFPIVAGILVAGLARRSWRQLTMFSLSVAPFAGMAAWNAVFSKKPASPISGVAGASLGWDHAWTFYTDYAGMWKLSVPDTNLFWLMLKNNAGMLLRQPADLLFGPTFVRDSMLGHILVMMAAVATIAGIVRLAREHGLRPIHTSLAFYIPILLLWNYPAANRFLLPFWPLVVAGAWIEARRLMQAVKSAFSRSESVQRKCLGFAVGVVAAALTCAVAENSLAGTRTVLMRTSDDRRTLMQAKQDCYDWIRSNAEPDARLIAYEDTATYLYTGRETVRPIVFTTDDFYDPQRLSKEASHMTDIAETIGARYWLFAADDYYREWPAATALEGSRSSELERDLPALFRAGSGTASVRSTVCLSAGCAFACGACVAPAVERPLISDVTTISAPARSER